MAGLEFAVDIPSLFGHSFVLLRQFEWEVSHIVGLAGNRCECIEDMLPRVDSAVEAKCTLTILGLWTHWIKERARNVGANTTPAVSIGFCARMSASGDLLLDTKQTLTSLCITKDLRGVRRVINTKVFDCAPF